MDDKVIILHEVTDHDRITKTNSQFINNNSSKPQSMYFKKFTPIKHYLKILLLQKRTCTSCPQDQVVRAPTPPPQIQRVVERAPTPEPGIVNRVSTFYFLFSQPTN